MIDLLVEILQFRLDGVPDEQNIILVFKEAYEILYTYMIGKSRKNALYFAKYIEFFQTQFTQKVTCSHKNVSLLLYIAIKFSSSDNDVNVGNKLGFQYRNADINRQVCFLGIRYLRCSEYLVIDDIIFQGGIGLNVAQMIVELIRDKRKIVDRISHQQIDEFVALLQSSQV